MCKPVRRRSLDKTGSELVSQLQSFLNQAGEKYTNASAGELIALALEEIDLSLDPRIIADPSAMETEL